MTTIARPNIVDNKNTYYTSIYNETNGQFENYLTRSDIEGKDVLTPVGDGDYLIWIMQNNPASIATFDSNIIAKYLQNLKIAALINFSYDEYINFFFGATTFRSFFAKALSILPDGSRELWAALSSNSDPHKMIEAKLLVQNMDSIRFNTFLRSETDYLKAKKEAYKLCYAFHNLGFDDLSTIRGKYDTIFLGNESKNYCTIGDAIKDIQGKTKGNLKPDGVVISPIVIPYFNREIKTDSVELVKTIGYHYLMRLKNNEQSR